MDNEIRYYWTVRDLEIHLFFFFFPSKKQLYHDVFFDKNKLLALLMFVAAG